MRVGETATVEVVHLSERGDGVADVDGRELHVAGGFPGETVEVRVDAVSRHHPRAFGALLRIVDAHPERRDPPCPRHVDVGGACTGCPLMALAPAAQRTLRQAMVRRLALPLHGEMSGGAELGYRWSAKRVVGGAVGAVILGSYRRGTHTVADMRGCLVDHPCLRDAADTVARAASTLGVRPYDGGSGDLRYVWLKTDGTRVLVTLICAHDDRAQIDALIAALPAEWGIAWSVQAGAGNAIRGRTAVTVRPPGALQLDLGGVTASVGALGFLQPNPAVASEAYAALVSDAAGNECAGELAYDLYAGAGVTTALLKRHFGTVVPCESHPESAAALGVEPEDALAFLQRDRTRPDLVVANPPRAGLGASVCDALINLGASRVNIMSCNAVTLASDLSTLATAYTVDSIRTFDTLPQTPHVELVAHLSRR